MKDPESFRVLIDHHEPFLLAHGGLQVQIEQTSAALMRRGQKVGMLRWWDAQDVPELIHFFGLPSLAYLDRAKAKKTPLVVTHLLTTSCNRTPARLFAQKLVTRTLLSLRCLDSMSAKMGWLSLQRADAVVVGLEAEKRFLVNVWGVPAERIHKIPLGVHRAFLDEEKDHGKDLQTLPEKFLVSVGTICARKRSLEIARLAKAGGIPMVFVGKPLSHDAYFSAFSSEIANSSVRYISHVSDPHKLASIYRRAAGFVHFSDGENWCLAAHEAAACRCPLLLPDQPWARERFNSQAAYWSEASFHTQRLTAFFNSPPITKANNIPDWDFVATALMQVYSQVRNFHA